MLREHSAPGERCVKLMTIPEILKNVASVVGSYSEASFRRDCRRLKIKPSGPFRSIPRRYPSNTAALIVSSRGFETALLPMTPTALPPIERGRLVSLSSLKRTRKAARKGGAS